MVISGQRLQTLALPSQWKKLEIVAGKEVAEIYAQGIVNLLDVLSKVLNEGGHERLRGFTDPSLQGNYPMEFAMFVATMIGTCIKKDPASRPHMHEIGLFVEMRNVSGHP
ncbi:hypothetical protein VNO77_01911 [Canavalia gladiata]|uniref:Uncharacterized protein n=1 Tax=Canavalia gladiata TaxID=3824 RepID=A0AAN9R5E9_CANGL